MPSDTSDFVGPKGAARILGVKVESIYTYKNRGDMPDLADQFGNTPIWRRKDIERMRERTDGKR